MTTLTESAIEQYAIELLEKQGYAPDVVPDGDNPDASTSLSMTTLYKYF